MARRNSEKMFTNSQEFLQKNTYSAKDMDEFASIMKTTKGLIKAYWCEGKTCESNIKEATTASTRLKLLDAKKKIKLVFTVAKRQSMNGTSAKLINSSKA